MNHSSSNCTTYVRRTNIRPIKNELKEHGGPCAAVRAALRPWTLVERCFTSTETVGLLGTGAQDGHLDFQTAPELSVPGSGYGEDVTSNVTMEFGNLVAVVAVVCLFYFVLVKLTPHPHPPPTPQADFRQSLFQVSVINPNFCYTKAEVLSFVT